MFNSIRVKFYTDSYLDYIKRYRNELKPTLCTYYLFDRARSIFDNEVLQSGGYERVGNLTGLKWYRILFFPVAFGTSAQKRYTQTEYGPTLPSETTAIFPRLFTPSLLDFIDYTDHSKQINHVYQVTNIEISYITDYVELYRCTLKSQYFNTEEISNQISETLCYNEYTDEIHTPTQHGNILVSLEIFRKTCTYIQEQVLRDSGLLCRR